MDAPLYPRREVYRVGACGRRPLDNLVAWANGGAFHRYGRSVFDEWPTVEEALERMREHPAVVDFRAMLVDGRLSWSLRYQRAGDADSWGHVFPFSSPEDAAYAALTMIEEHERERYEQTLVVGCA